MTDEKEFKMREELPDDLQAGLKRIMDNFLIAFVKRQGGRVEFPVAEIDAADDMLTMEVDQARGVFTLVTKVRN